MKLETIFTKVGKGGGGDLVTTHCNLDFLHNSKYWDTQKKVDVDLPVVNGKLDTELLAAAVFIHYWLIRS